MSSIQERLQLKRVPLDTWNIREQLCLASAVVRSGDQNWMSVSRALKTIGEPNRPPDWYSQKSCAAQYGALLEHVETPKRKKRNSEGAVETPQESILKKLTQERMVEIQKNVAEMHQLYEQMKTEIAEARNPLTSEERLREMWTNIEVAKRTKEREAARRAAWLKEREERRSRTDRQWLPSQPTTPTSPVPAPVHVGPPASPLLTSLLKSSPVVTTPQHISHPANMVDVVSPSVTAPTLSMLLEKSAVANCSQHESRHAAIEHIKSQLQEIEHQLNVATTSGVQLPAPVATVAPPIPAVDIDDIEIKAEDVYAFRDIDIHIPPVAHMHKNNTRTTEKLQLKKEEPEESSVEINLANSNEILQEENATKEEDSFVPVVEGTVSIGETEKAPEEEPSSEARPQSPVKELTVEEDLRINFPEVKFPTTEIKVIQPEDQKQVKEEIKEPEIPVPEPEQPVEEVHEVQEEKIKEPVPLPVVKDEVASLEEQSVPEPEEPAPESPATEDEPVPVEVPIPLPQDIPLPPDDPVDVQHTEEKSDPPLPPEPELPTVQEEDQETVKVKEEQVEKEVPEQRYAEESVDDKNLSEIKREEDAEDSIPLKQMLKKELSERHVEDAHTETDDDTPMELSREEEKDGKKKRDYSRKKKSESRTWSGSESAAEASAPESPGGGGGGGGGSGAGGGAGGTSSANDAERHHRLWKKSVMLVYSRLCAHKYASLFVRPITDEEAPGYSLVVKRPMDLSTIRRNIDNGIIRTTAEFQRDVLLMLSNALIYNSSEHSVYAMAKEMHEEAQCQLGMLLAAQAHAGLCAAPAAGRRKRRRADEHGDQQHRKRTH